MTRKTLRPSVARAVASPPMVGGIRIHVCCLLFVAAIIRAATAAASSQLLSSAADATAALAVLQQQGADDLLGSEDVQYALEHGWWEPAKQMLRTMRERGDAVTTMQGVRTTATSIRDEATEIINLLRVGANKEETVVNCAFQWAQRPDYIYLNVKFSSRIDGPVTVLNVDNENVTFTNESVHFEGTGRQKPKKFQLHLPLNKAIDPERSQWSFASVGRISITLAKAEVETWPKLLAKDATKPKNMHAWYERQTVLDEQVKKEAKAKKEAREAEDKKKADEEKAAKEAKEKGSGGEGAAPPVPPTPAPTDGEAQGGEPPAPKAKKEKKGKKAKKDKGDKKEEL